jgi:hypothetical protein
MENAARKLGKGKGKAIQLHISIAETIRLHRLCWFGHARILEENRIPKRRLYMNLESTRPRGRPRIDNKMK